MSEEKKGLAPLLRDRLARIDLGALGGQASKKSLSGNFGRRRRSLRSHSYRIWVASSRRIGRESPKGILGRQH